MTDKQKFKYVVIIPTCGKPHVELKFLRLLKNSEENTLFIYSINPVDRDEAEMVFEKMGAIQSYAERYYGRKHNVVKLWEDHSTSFGDACNKGYEYAMENCEGAEAIIFLNDDVNVTFGWQKKLRDTLYAKKYFTNTTLTMNKPGRMVKKMPFKIGFAGPLSDNVGSSQQIQPPEGWGLDQVAADIQSRSVSIDGSTKNIVTLFLSGFCLACNPELLAELYQEDGYIFDPIYKIGGYEDNDLAVRGLRKGWVSLIDNSTFVAHDGSMTLDSEFQENRRGLSNLATYLNKWKGFTQRDQKLVAAYRVAILNVNNLAQLGSSIRINHKFVDAMAILLTNNPSDSLESYDKQLFDRLNYQDQEFLVDCKSITDSDKLAERFKEWISHYVSEGYELKVEAWDLSKRMNEREERNYNYEMATSMEADWVMSIDADECLEDRMEEDDLRNLMKNPDPMVSSYTFGWLNHYESMNVIRTDYPYCNGYLHGMNGARMWRVWNGKHFPIIAGNEIGLHCGNAPEYGSYVVKGTNFRFRHLSMVREIDRVSKTTYYNETDQDKNVDMIGNEDYSHISRSENVPVTIYRRNNGIGFFHLAYDKEDMIFLADKMRNYSPCSDDYIVVWTSEWKEEDRGWQDIDVDDFPSESQWRETYATGPEWFIAVVAKLHGVKFIHHPFSDGLAMCRNQALKHFYTNGTKKIGWALYLDPDEIEKNHSSMVVASFRRMAEATSPMAFRFTFQNLVMLRGGKQHNSMSDSMRMINLNINTPVFFSGKVHESIEKSLNLLKQQGVTIYISNCPIQFLNAGLSQEPHKLTQKLIKYQSLLVDTLKENPYESGAWTSLGMTYEQDEDHRNAELCYERACLTAGKAYLPFQALGLFYARRAMGLFAGAMERSKNVPSLYDEFKSVFTMIREKMGDYPIIDTAGAKPSTEFELPPFPYNEMVYDERNNEIVKAPEGLSDNNPDKGIE